MLNDKEFEAAADAMLRLPQIYSYTVSAVDAIVCADTDGKRDLYEIRQGGKQLFPLFDSRENRVAPTYVANERWLLFFQDFEGDECFDMHVAWKEEGVWKERNLTPDTSFSIIPASTFSNDGKMAAFVSDEAGGFDTFIMEARNGRRRRLTNSGCDVYAAISPDGAYTAIVKQSTEETEIEIVRTTDGRRVFRVEDGGKAIDASDPFWFEDSRRFAFVSGLSGYSTVGIADVQQGKVSWLRNGGKDCYSPVVSRDGGSAAWVTCKDADIKMVCESLKTGIRAEYGETGAGSVRDIQFSRDGSILYFLFEGPSFPTGLFRLHRPLRSLHQVASAGGSTPQLAFVEGKEIRYKSADGREIPAVLYAPADRSGVGVVYIHGGPTAAYMNCWDPTVQLLCAKGVTVIAPNYRGSTCYGKEFRDANRYVMGRRDMEDCAAAAEYLISNRLADAQRIGVTGASFGGYLTMCCLAFRNDLWKCGSAVVPFMNWFTEIESERADLRTWDLSHMGDPQKDAARLKDASPYFFLERIKAPVQIIAGEHDPRCPKSESEAAAARLKELGKEVEYLCYSGEGHSFRNVENRYDADKRCLHFLLHHLLAD
ncbi:MAG: prolyl oligopeptidase family serine peptidase [Methanomassiliicoccales archaeon]